MMDVIGGIFWFIGAILGIIAFFIILALFAAIGITLAIPGFFMFVGAYLISKA